MGVAKNQIYRQLRENSLFSHIHSYYIFLKKQIKMAQTEAVSKENKPGQELPSNQHGGFRHPFSRTTQKSQTK